MKINLKMFMAAVLCVAMMLSLCACGDTAPAGTTAGADSGEAVTVTGPISIEFWHTRSGDQGTMLDEQIKRFNESNPYGITVTGTYQGSYYDVLSKVKTAYGTNIAPQIVLVGAGGIEELAENGALADMSAYVERDNWDLDNIPESLKYYMTHFENQIIEFPYLVSSAIIYYNKAYYPAEPTSLEEFAAMAKEITANNPDVVGMGFVLDTGFVQRPILRSLGAPGLTLGNGEEPALLNDNYLITYMNDWKSWIDGGYCAPIGGGGLGVLSTASSQEIAAAWEFIKFLYEDEQVVENAKNTGYMPYTYSAGKHPDMLAYWEENPLAKVPYEQLEYATYNEWSIYLEQWRDKVAAAFSYVITDQSMTPEQAINFLRTQAEAIFP